ncbi:MAG TPA: carboxypeptidase-like regulatory domain-containing protein [Thermoanaerobaculia bacterium]|nr:carboxypeptidase-like regulatory domain-containing protein [Thermoanaerobaculia bacterium]
MKSLSRRAPVLAALAGLLCLLAAILAPRPAAAASRYDQGQRIQVTGVVTDAQGQPLQGIRVVLEVSRTYFSIRSLRRTAAPDVRRVSAVTDARGNFTVEWPWDDYFNHFELVAGIPVRTRAGDTVQELARQEITRRVQAGSPAVVAVTIDNRQFLDNFRQFLASIKTDDQRKVYQEMGRPDRIRNVQYPGYLESSWWYFEAGRVYRFRDGRLEQITPFDPVRGL